MPCCAVIVTIGPACQDVDTLCQLLEAGATCARCDLTVSFSIFQLAKEPCHQHLLKARRGDSS